MTGDLWTVLVVRDEKSPVKQFSMSSRVLRVAVGGFVALALLVVGSAVTVGLDGYSRLTAHDLESRNEALRVEFEQFGDLGERKSRCLCRFDEAQTAQNRLVVTPDSAFRRGAGRLRRNGQQAAAFVEPDRVDTDRRLLG